MKFIVRLVACYLFILAVQCTTVTKLSSFLRKELETHALGLNHDISTTKNHVEDKIKSRIEPNHDDQVSIHINDKKNEESLKNNSPRFTSIHNKEVTISIIYFPFLYNRNPCSFSD